MHLGEPILVKVSACQGNPCFSAGAAALSKLLPKVRVIR